MAENGTLLIVGASVRAAAFSALRAGVTPLCADLFADWDLAQCCQALRVAAADYPANLMDVARRAPLVSYCKASGLPSPSRSMGEGWGGGDPRRIRPPHPSLPHKGGGDLFHDFFNTTLDPWMYTGALENHPHVVAEISRLRPLWGNSPEVLAKVRDPFLVAQALAEEGLPHPEVRPSADDLPRDGTWLIKPLHSAGGAGIRVLLPTTRLSIPAVECCVGDRGRHGRLPRPYYLQQFVDGLPCSALYLAAGGQALLLGVTRQLVGEAAFHARTFTYCGSIGPLNLQRQIVERFGKLGRVLARRFGLIGLFGVDCVLRDGHPFPVEINPRWTASVEVLEYALGFCAMQLHADACRGRLADPLTHQFLLPATRRLADPPPRVPCVGKAILYADNDRIAPEPHAWFKAFSGEPFSARQPPDPTPMPPVADIPFAGQRLLRGRPVMTLLVRGESVEGCITMLQDRSAAALEMCSPP